MSTLRRFPWFWLLALAVQGLACNRQPAAEPQRATRPASAAATTVPVASFNAPQGPFDFKLPTVGGGPLRLSSLRGSPVLVNFWATWCAPCRREIDYLADLHNRRDGRPFHIVGVSVDADPAAVQFWAGLRQIPYPVVVADEAVKGQFGGIDRVPVTFLLDGEGRTIRAYPGSPQDLGVFERDLVAALGTAAVAGG